MLSEPSRPSLVPRIGGLNKRAGLVPRQLRQRLCAQLRREVDDVVRNVDEVSRVGRRLGRKWLRRRVRLAWNVAARNRTFLDRPHRLTCHAIEHVKEVLLARHGDGFDGAAVHVDVGQQRRRRHVEVPERVMHELEMPLPLAGLQVDAHEAFGKQVVPRPVTAVVIGGR